MFFIVPYQFENNCWWSEISSLSIHFSLSSINYAWTCILTFFLPQKQNPLSPHRPKKCSSSFRDPFWFSHNILFSLDIFPRRSLSPSRNITWLINIDKVDFNVIMFLWRLVSSYVCMLHLDKALHVFLL